MALCTVGRALAGGIDFFWVLVVDGRLWIVERDGAMDRSRLKVVNDGHRAESGLKFPPVPVPALVWATGPCSAGKRPAKTPGRARTRAKDGPGLMIPGVPAIQLPPIDFAVGHSSPAACSPLPTYLSKLCDIFQLLALELPFRFANFHIARPSPVGLTRQVQTDERLRRSLVKRCHQQHRQRLPTRRNVTSKPSHRGSYRRNRSTSCRYWQGHQAQIS